MPFATTLVALEVPVARRSVLVPLAVAVATVGAVAGSAAATTVPPDGDAAAVVGSVPDPAECMADVATITDGVLTIATGEPAFPPYVIDDDPTNQQGFEAAVAYAVAGLLGFGDDQVEWIRTPFDTVIAPGLKDFDFNVQQYSITPERAEIVSFSLPYYSAPQAILGYADSPAATATSLDDLRNLRIGVATGTTAVPFVEDVIQPREGVQIFNDNAAAKSALDAKQIDAFIGDLPTALYISAVEIEGSQVFGQFVAADGTTGEDLGFLFEKDNPLVECVDLALLTLRQTGELDAITDQWMVAEVVPLINLDG